MRTRIMSEDRRSSSFASAMISVKSSRDSQMLRRVACGLLGRFAFFGRRGDGRGIRVHYWHGWCRVQQPTA
jgi:hypothetical protein